MDNYYYFYMLCFLFYFIYVIIWTFLPCRRDDGWTPSDLQECDQDYIIRTTLIFNQRFLGLLSFPPNLAGNF